jgi:hypothetical protein
MTQRKSIALQRANPRNSRTDGPVFAQPSKAMLDSSAKAATTAYPAGMGTTRYTATPVTTC